MTDQKPDDKFKENFEIEITEEDLETFKRFDQLLKAKLPDYSRTYIKKLYLEGFIETDVPIKMNKMPRKPTKVEVTIPFPEDYFIEPEDIPLEVLYEDEHIIVINKQANIVVHPAPGHWTGTLVNALLHHCKDLSGIGQQKRPGIVHRLDKGTTGVMVMAKSQKAHEKLCDMFRAHDLKRQYIALTFRSVRPQAGTMKSIIGRSNRNRLKMTTHISNGKEAITHFQVLESFKAHTYVRLTLETGRTHQIRVHLTELKNAAILNDPVYGNPPQQKQNLPILRSLTEDYNHPLLHAEHLEFKHPITNKLMSFTTEPNEIFQAALKELRDGV